MMTPSERGVSLTPLMQLSRQIEQLGWAKDLATEPSNEMRRFSEEVADILAIATTKSRLAELADRTAREAKRAAFASARLNPSTTSARLLPLLCVLRYERCYLEALELILNLPKRAKKLGDFRIEEQSASRELEGGVLSAVSREIGAGDWVVEIFLGPHTVPPTESERAHVCSVIELSRHEAEAVEKTICTHGRIGKADFPGQEFKERLSSIRVMRCEDKEDRIASYLWSNRDAIVRLMSRYGFDIGLGGENSGGRGLKD